MAGYGTFATAAEDGVAKSSATGHEEAIDGEGGDDSSVEDLSRTRHLIDKGTLLAFYTSHALFMANNRSYEFGSVLFTASAFPHTLVAAALRGLSAHLASVLLSPSVGRWCDTHPSRLRPVQICIVLQRFCIALASLGWALIVQESEVPLSPGLDKQSRGSPSKQAIFAGLLVLGMLERLSAVGNQIVVERDWIPLLAASSAIRKPRTDPLIVKPALSEREAASLLGRDPPKLHNLNAMTKFIDLIAKLVTPLAVSAIAIGFSSVGFVAALLALIQLFSCGIELHLTNIVWRAYPGLQVPKSQDQPTATAVAEDNSPSSARSFAKRIRHSFHSWLTSLRVYTKSSAFLPSLAFALEPFSVLTLAGSMTSYLLVANFPLTHITAARAASTLVEISSTILTPLLIAWHSHRLRKRNRHQEPEPQDSSNLRSLTLIGLLGLSWQLVFLIPATVILILVGSTTIELSTATKLTAVLFSTLALSRLGPFAYSLVEQQIVQVEVPSYERMQFSGVEMALVDLSELARWGMLGIFGSPREFRWVAVISFCSVGLTLGLFGSWMRKRPRRHQES